LKLVFEVKEKDLLGRVGRVYIKGKRLDTPAFIPVISPYNQIIPPSEMKKRFRCNMVITNSYIIYRRFGEAGVEKGVHRIINFDGIVMTDSGGFQVLEYGDIDINPVEIAVYQERIGSDVAVPLDKPTGLTSRQEAEETVRVTLDNIAKTFNSLGDERRSCWTAPIQGGLYHDLLERCIKELLKYDFDLFSLGSPTPLMERYQYGKLVDMMFNARLHVPLDKPLHLFGAGHPMLFPFAVALGYDTFDSASYVLFAKADRYMLSSRTVKLENLAYLPCECSVCSLTTAEELRKLEKNERVKLLAMHNLSICFREVELIKQHIHEGRFFELLESRARAHPALMQAFSNIIRNDKIMQLMANHTPLTKPRGMYLFSAESLRRPEIRRGAERLEKVMSSSPTCFGMRRTAILIPHKLVITLKLEKLLQRLRKLENYGEAAVFTYYTPFGIVPLSLSRTYPFSQLSYPKSLIRDNLNQISRETLKKLRNLGFETVILIKSGGEPPSWFLEGLGEVLAKEFNVRAVEL